MTQNSFETWLNRRRLKDFPPVTSPAELADSLITLRFPFTRDSVGEPFIQQVRETLASLPPILLQKLHRHGVRVELDAVCEIAAILEMEKQRLWLARQFLLEGRLYDTADNPVFPYGLRGILLHEMAHLLDWTLTPNGRISGLAIFQTAFAEDVANIPDDMKMTHHQRVALCDKAGGYFGLSEADREKADLAIFVLQDEETFADSFSCHMTGIARPAVLKYFPHTIEATRKVIETYLEPVSAEFR